MEIEKWRAGQTPIDGSHHSSLRQGTNTDAAPHRVERENIMDPKWKERARFCVFWDRN